MNDNYRCGYCGQPTDKDGRVLSLDEVLSLDPESKEVPTHGNCCAQQAHYECDRRTVTREMAADAGDPSLEGFEL